MTSEGEHNPDDTVPRETDHQENRPASVELGDPVQNTVDQVTEAAQDMASAATNASIEASQGTAQAFDDARNRLRGMSVGNFGAGAIIEQMKAQSEALSGPLGDTFQRAAKGMAEFNAKALEAWRANAEATVQHLQKLAGARSFSEVIALNAEHARRQMETFASQTREFGELAGKIAQSASYPIQNAAKKTGGF